MIVSSGRDLASTSNPTLPSFSASLRPAVSNPTLPSFSASLRPAVPAIAAASATPPRSELVANSPVGETPSDDQKRGACEALAREGLASVDTLQSMIDYWAAQGLDPAEEVRANRATVQDLLDTADAKLSAVVGQCQGHLDDATMQKVRDAQETLAGLKGRLESAGEGFDWAGFAESLGNGIKVILAPFVFLLELFKPRPGMA